MSTIITEHTVQPYEIVPIIANIEAALEGSPREHCIIGMLSMVLIMTHPGISQEQLASAVKDVSRYICLVLDPPESGLMN